MNIILRTFLFSTLIISINVKSQEILTQGGISLYESEIDGYAFTIPEKERVNYFSSIQKIEEVILKILNMKHIVNYGKINSLFNLKKIKEKVSFDILELSHLDNLNLIKKEYQIDQIKKYLIIKESYYEIQKTLLSNITDEELLPLAQERYELGKSKYLIKRSVDFDYISVNYNEEVKETKLKKVQNILKAWKSGGHKFKELNKKHSDEVVLDTVTTYYSNSYNKELSEYLDNATTLGVQDTILNLNNYFMLIRINKINKQRYKPFAEVQSEIIKGLKFDKYRREFSSLLNRLTQDEIVINEELVFSLSKRYLN